MKNRILLILLMLAVWFVIAFLAGFNENASPSYEHMVKPAESTICVLETKAIENMTYIKRVCIDGYEFVVVQDYTRGVAVSPSFKGLGLKKCTCEKPKPKTTPK